VIQDSTSKSPIGVGRLLGWVCYFNKTLPPTIQVNTVGTHTLWHGRLRHPSDQVLSLLSKSFLVLVIMGIMDLVTFVFVLSKYMLNLLLVKVMLKNSLI